LLPDRALEDEVRVEEDGGIARRPWSLNCGMGGFFAPRSARGSEPQVDMDLFALSITSPVGLVHYQTISSRSALAQAQRRSPGEGGAAAPAVPNIGRLS
jgi:hypothetical protein